MKTSHAISIALETVGLSSVDEWIESSGPGAPLAPQAVGVCLGCGETEDVDPGTGDGYCAGCGTYSVRGLDVLTGVSS